EPQVEVDAGRDQDGHRGQDPQLHGVVRHPVVAPAERGRVLLLANAHDDPPRRVEKEGPPRSPSPRSSSSVAALTAPGHCRPRETPGRGGPTTQRNGDRILGLSPGTEARTKEARMPGSKRPGPSVKDDEKYEALRREGESKEKAARIANAGAGSSPS